MNKPEQIKTQAELERLIECYFDGMTTVEQEAALREALAQCPWQSETINEAKAVMGYFVAHSQQRRRTTTHFSRLRIAGIAATIALLIAIGGYHLWHTHGQTTDDVCIAYVNGKVLDNSDEVMALIEQDLNSINAASQGMTAQLSSLGEAIERRLLREGRAAARPHRLAQIWHARGRAGRDRVSSGRGMDEGFSGGTHGHAAASRAVGVARREVPGG